MPFFITKYPELKNWLFLIVVGVLFSATSCDKEPAPTGPSDEDLARCAHVIDNGFLYQVCLNNPWPTELPPPTQEGLSTFGCWINDTLAFVANDPREPARKEAYLTHYRSTWGGGVLLGLRDTYNEIDPLSISLNIAFDFADPSLKLLTSGTRCRINSSNQYVCDSLKSSANINRRPFRRARKSILMLFEMKRNKQIYIASTLLYLIMLLLTASCTKSDNEGPTYSQEDRDRCAHIDRDAELGEYLYGICLSSPWPTELPLATQQGLSTFGCWINDTLAFVASDPRELPRNVVKYTKGIPVSQLIAYRSTYNTIDSRDIRLNFSIGENQQPFVNRSVELRISEISRLSGTYQIDSAKSEIQFVRLDDSVAAGTFDLTFYKPNTTDTIRLTDGRFDVLVNQF